MTETIYRQASIKAAGKGDARVVDCCASTDTLDSYGERVEQKWDLKRYNANPVVLFAHNSREMPIGKASNVRMENGALCATLELVADDVNPKAGEVWRAIQAGVLRAVSVGFDSHSYRWEKADDREVLVLSDNELMEISICAVPANPDALMRLRTKARSAATTPRNPMTQDEEKELLALTGKKTVGEALAVVAAQRETVTAHEKLATENRDLKAKAELAARTAALTTGPHAHKITPAMRADAKWVKYVETRSLDDLEAYLETLPVPVPAAVEAKTKSGAEGSGAEITLTEEEINIAKQMGNDPAELLAQKRELAARKVK